MYKLFGQPRTLDSLAPDAHLNIPKRDAFPIMVIDDDPFPYCDLLRNSHFNLTQVEDISDIRSVSDYPIVMCDIRGVGTGLSRKFEGAYVIKEIRKEYPHKYIIAYTGTTYDPTYNPYLASADRTMKKDADSEEWVKCLDSAIAYSADPRSVWCRLRAILLEKGVSIVTVMKLEDQFVGFVRRKDRAFPDPGFPG